MTKTVKMEILLKIIDDIEKQAKKLSKNFGRGINNPLLRGQDIPELISYSVWNYIYQSWIFWNESVQKNKDDKKDKTLFRATIIYLDDLVDCCLEERGLSESDYRTGESIQRALGTVIRLVDNDDAIKGGLNGKTEYSPKNSRTS